MSWIDFRKKLEVRSNKDVMSLKISRQALEVMSENGMAIDSSIGLQVVGGETGVGKQLAGRRNYSR
jgi:hypothetical protein